MSGRGSIGKESPWRPPTMTAERPSHSDSADVDEINLAATLVRRIDSYLLAVRAEAGVRVATELAGVLLRQVEVAERVALRGFGIEKIWILIPLAIRIRVVQNPSLVGQVGAVAIDRHDIAANDFYFGGTVLIQVESIAIRGVTGPCEDVSGVAPDEVGGLPVWIDHVKIGAIGIGGNHAGREGAIGGLLPAMQKYETLSVRSDQKMIEPVF